MQCAPFLRMRKRVIKLLREMFDNVNPEVEHCIVVGVDQRGQVLCASVIASGVRDGVLISPTEVFRSAILARAQAVYVAHNHPCGSLEATEDDWDATAKLVRGGVILGIRLEDHFIFTRRRHRALLG